MRSIVLLAISLLFTANAAASEASPEEVACRYTELFYSGKAREAFALRDPSEFKLERKSTESIVRSNAKARAVLFEDKTDAQLDELSDVDYISLYWTRFFAEAASKAGASVPLPAHAKALGAVNDGSDVRFVVCKLVVELGGKTTETVDLVRVVKAGSEWRVGLPAGLTAIGP